MKLPRSQESAAHAGKASPSGPSRTRAGTALSATVRVIMAEVERRGLDPVPLLARHGLHTPRLWHPLERAPRQAILEFVETCNAAARDPGLHVSATLQAAIGAFEIADYMAIMAPTMGHSFRVVGERFDLVNDGIRVRFEESADVVNGTLVAMFEPLPHPIETECTLVAAEHRIRHATGGAHGLSHVAFSHADRGSRAALVRAFQCPVSFDAPQDTFSMTRTAWDTPPLFRRPSLDSLLTLAPLRPTPPAVPPFVQSVRRALSSGLSTGDQQAADVARRLGVSARTLQRKLTAAGYSLTDLLSDVRRDAAMRQLADPRLSVSEISSDLGFSEPSAFARAFKRWTGLTPTEYRDETHVATLDAPKVPALVE